MRTSQLKHILKLLARERLGTRWAKYPFSRRRLPSESGTLRCGHLSSTQQTAPLASRQSTYYVIMDHSKSYTIISYNNTNMYYMISYHIISHYIISYHIVHQRMTQQRHRAGVDGGRLLSGRSDEVAAKCYGVPLVDHVRVERLHACRHGQAARPGQSSRRSSSGLEPVQLAAEGRLRTGP